MSRSKHPTIMIIMPLAEQRGGGESSLMHLMQGGMHLSVRWHVVFLRSGPMVETCRNLGATVTVIEAGRLRDVPRFVRTVLSIASLARRDGVALILGWMGTAHLYGGLAAKLAGVKAAWFQLGIPSARDRLDRLASLIPAEAVMTVSKAGQEAQRALMPRTPLPIVYPAAELDRFDPERLPSPREARERLGLPLDVPLIGIVGRLQRWKGMHVLIEAMPRVRAHFADAHCVIVGGTHAPEADYPIELQRQIEAQSASSYVHMVGQQSDIPTWMQAMDIVVHASSNEPFGIVIVEAMSLGKPVIATDEGGPLEILEPGKQGLLTRFGDSEQLANAIIELLSDRERAITMGNAARTRAERFSVESFARNLTDALRPFFAAASSR